MCYLQPHQDEGTVDWLLGNDALYFLLWQDPQGFGLLIYTCLWWDQWVFVNVVSGLDDLAFGGGIQA